MKLLHIADLHIGKRVNEFNMLEDQQYILGQILNIAESERSDGILIAGDVYDKSQPSSEAVELLDEFITAAVSRRLPVYMISGNHDSPERLGFGRRVMQESGLFIAGTFTGRIQMETLFDEHGPVNIYLLPYIKPAVIKPYFDTNIETYEEAVRTVISAAGIDTEQRNILLAHQFVTSGAEQPYRSQSESISVGGTDNVDAHVFEAFDYVALGHLHGPQHIGRETVRYAGSPLKYSLSEVNHTKSLTLIELGAKKDIDIRTIPLTPMRDTRHIKGPIAALLEIGRQEKHCSEDYIHATLTDEDEIYDAIGQLRQVYPNLMALDFENSRSGGEAPLRSAYSDDTALKSPVEIFTEFFRLQHNTDLTPEQLAVMERVFSKAATNSEQ